MSRRSLLFTAAMSGALHAFSPTFASGQSAPKESVAGSTPGKLKIAVFSKHLQWVSIAEAAAIAKEIGFDGIDLTVRSGGHVEPARVQQDLPAAVEAIHKAGLEIPMITTDINSATMPHAEIILKTAGQLGIDRYRWGGLKYQPNQPIATQLENLKPKMLALAELNRQAQVCGMYHTHSGPGMIGASIWDVWLLFRDLDPKWIGINYDIGHATVEGGYGGWIASAKLVKDYMRGICLKDFLWERNPKFATHADSNDKSLEGAYVPGWCAIGEGMVNFPGFFEIVKANSFSGPVQLHFEYPGLGGAEDGHKTLTIPRKQVIDTMRTDLNAVRGYMKKQSLI
ncbi:MAG: sugar phosphate isomerase/epimerase family protein [Granulicella sp.]